jgi:hypothetical protein
MKIHIGSPVNNKGDRKLSIDITEDDVWDMDNQLSMIILPMLLLLKEESTAGMPPNFVYVGGEEYLDQASFDFYSDTTDWAWQENSKNWHKVLDKMIWSFQQLAYTEYYVLYNREEAHDSTIKRSAKVEKWYDLAGHNEHERRIQEGLDLFARHYRYLWF